MCVRNRCTRNTWTYMWIILLLQVRIWTSYQIRKIEGRACAMNASNVFPATDFKWNHKLAIPACIMAHGWPLSGKKPIVSAPGDTLLCGNPCFQRKPTVIMPAHTGSKLQHCHQMMSCIMGLGMYVKKNWDSVQTSVSYLACSKNIRVLFRIFYFAMTASDDVSTWEPWRW